MAKSTYGTWANTARTSESTMSTGQRLKVVTPRNLQASSRETWMRLKREAFLANAYLVPLRLFIGIGWLRAAVEKLVEPTWYNGDALRAFLGSFERIRTFPAFESLLRVARAAGRPGRGMVGGRPPDLLRSWNPAGQLYQRGVVDRDRVELDFHPGAGFPIHRPSIS